MDTERVDSVVIGAGVVGLACARALARAGHETLVLEAAAAIGTGISARNSEVLHAGMYYPAGSLKAALCVRGHRLLWDFMARHGVAHRLVGKLIVATDAGEEAQLEELRRKGAVNGVEGLHLISGSAAQALEPALRCRVALASPATGILDVHGLLLALRGDAEAHGAALALKSPVEGGEVAASGILLRVGGTEPVQLLARRVVNAAGLGAQGVAAGLAGLPPVTVPPLHLCKGNYFVLEGRQPFGRLVYPVPAAAGLGVHYTLDLGGRGRFGPDVEWIGTEDYTVDPARGYAFYAAIRRYWPALPDGVLGPGYAGIRPKLGPPGTAAQDFVIQGPESHGVAGLVNLFGIESPGLTASLAIAERVTALLEATAQP